MKRYPVTPDGRYFVAKNRLWRCHNPKLDDATLTKLKSALGAARAQVRNSEPRSAKRRDARKAVNAVKIALGERGPVWWTDGAPDVNRKAPKNTCYADWWHDLSHD